MLKKLRNLDTTELLILVGLLGVLIFGGFHIYLRQQVNQSREELADAKRTIPQVFTLLKQIPDLYTAARDLQVGAEDVEFAPYFQRQLSMHAKIDLNSYQIGAPTTRTIDVMTGRTRKKAIETKVRIDFKKGSREKVYIPRSNLFTALYNAEAMSRRWRLSQLKIRAKELDMKGARGKAPPEELSDEWSVEQLEFVSRAPER